jgi:hypothetical protein
VIPGLLGITGENPYNPFDQNTVRDVTYSASSVASVTHATSYACQNENQTRWWAIGVGTLVRGGTTYYTPAVNDVTSVIRCGW